jgi:hypothetical protein
VELVVSAKDAAGHAAPGGGQRVGHPQGELWFEQDNDDRIDVLPEKKRYEPGETARLQVRMPFREATALVAVEREGVIDTRVVTLRGDDPTVEVKIDKAWAPNVYVSVLALRGRIREVPWYSFFAGAGRSRWTGARLLVRRARVPGADRDGRPGQALVQARRGALQVGLAAHELQVTVTPDKPQYGMRQKALVRIKVTQGGKPAGRAPRWPLPRSTKACSRCATTTSWDLLQRAMIRSGPGACRPATAQSEIIGRRHYGRKAVAAGGGGGKGATRELFDTLLLWKPRVVLDANGEALIEVPLNDSLTSFRLVAVADAGAQRFGTGSASIRVTQDLQVLSACRRWCATATASARC